MNPKHWNSNSTSAYKPAVCRVINFGKLPELESVVTLIANSSINSLPHVRNDVLQSFPAKEACFMA